MELEIYLAYVLVSAFLILLPGPIVTLVMANSLSHGVRTGLFTAAGATLGSGILLMVGGFGMASLLTFLLDWLIWLRWIGAAYLIFLGIRQWRAPVHGPGETTSDAGSARIVFLHGFIVAITNPKTILFFVAFFPHFIDPDGHVGSQLSIMCATFLILAMILDSSYALLAGHVRSWLIGEKPGLICNQITGALLIMTGISLALMSKG